MKSQLDVWQSITSCWLVKMRKTMSEWAVIIQQALGNSKSTAMKSLTTPLIVCAAGAVLAKKYDAPVWLMAVFGIGACLSLLVFLGTFIFFAVTKPDYLRSERYNFQVQALRQGYVGDNLSGWSRIRNISEPLQTESPSHQLDEGGGNE